MPNWIAGDMRIRGKKKDLLQFLENGIDPMSEEYNLSVDNDEIYGALAKGSYIKETRNVFLTSDFSGFVEDDDDDYIVVLPVKQTWCWDETDFSRLSQKYNLDFKLIGWERGMGFEQELVCLRREEPVDIVRKFPNWEWDSPCPRMGG